VLIKGQVWAFHDLADSRGAFKQAVDQGSTEKLDSASVLKSDDKNIYMWLLASACSRQDDTGDGRNWPRAAARPTLAPHGPGDGGDRRLEAEGHLVFAEASP
jgi:hypothetical protein